jgi:predicted metal-binding membrane protein
MTVSMMLPSSIPLLRYFRQANSTNHVDGAAVMFLAGYAAVWTAFAGDTVIHHLVDEWIWLAERTWLIAGSTLVIAGGFQFTPLKGRCLA